MSFPIILPGCGRIHRIRLELASGGIQLMQTRVLVADDDEQVLTSLSGLLESAGYCVVGRARSGREACELNSTLNPDIVLLDVKMPDMDGLNAAKTMMETSPVPVVLCTAYCDQELIDGAARAGVFGYITKPFRLQQLVPAMTVARNRYQDAINLKKEIGGLEKTLEDRKWIEKAKGIVMRRRGMDEEQAHSYLQKESQRRSQPLAELAKAIVMAEDMLKTRIIGGSGRS